MCGWNSTARDLIDELQGRRLQAEDRRPRRARQEPGRVRRLLRPRRRDQRRGPRACRDPGRLGGPGLPDRRLGRGRHALDPGDHGHRIDRAAGSGPSPRSTTRSTSRTSCRAEVDELLVTSKIASQLLARSALYPGLSGDRHRHRVGRARAPSSTGSPCPTSTSGSRSTASPMPPAQDHRRRCCRSTAAASAFVNPGTDFVLQAGRRRDRRGRGARDRWRRSRCTTSTPCRGPRRSSRAPDARRPVPAPGARQPGELAGLRARAP